MKIISGALRLCCLASVSAKWESEQKDHTANSGEDSLRGTHYRGGSRLLTSITTRKVNRVTFSTEWVQLLHHHHKPRAWMLLSITTLHWCTHLPFRPCIQVPLCLNQHHCHSLRPHHHLGMFLMALCFAAGILWPFKLAGPLRTTHASVSLGLSRERTSSGFTWSLSDPNRSRSEFAP